MMRWLIILLSLFQLSSLTFSQQEFTPVYISGSEGYSNFRIPAIIRLPDGDLLAFCEGRVKNAGDFGDVDIIMKRSKDKGKTWGAIQKIVDNDTLQAGNSAPVVDLFDSDFPNGRIFLFYNTGNNHEGEIRKGNGFRDVWFKTSIDGGTTWSEPVNITLQVHRPNNPKSNPNYKFAEDWRTTANTPGHAIQLETGKYRGRIFVAANHSSGNPQPEFRDYNAHAYYTDDHGKTFHLSMDVRIPGSNESTAAELSEGKVMMNSRYQSGDINSRIVSISGNGGQSWDTTYFDFNLPDPVCQGSLLSFTNQNGKRIVAFCNPADTTRRNSLTLRISFDEGISWKKNFLIDKSDSKKRSDYTAYSDLVKLSENEIGIFYERKNYSQIVFTNLNWEKDGN